MPDRWLPRLRREWFFAISLLTGIVFLASGDQLLQGLDRPCRLLMVFAWLFGTILGSALAVVRHADRLAERLGEPYGTLILTLSVTSIEVVSISAVMLHGANNPTLARDSLFAVTMIILNGMIGLSLLIGGWRRLEQHFNLQGANAYMGVIIPLGVLSLVLPDFTVSSAGSSLTFAQEMFVAAASTSLYVMFLLLQTSRHRGYFAPVQNAGVERLPERPANLAGESGHSLAWHALLLVAYMAPVVFLAEKLATPVDYVVETMRAPSALAGLTMAVLVATPEAISAVRAARRDQLTRSVNISLGSVLSTIGLTIPAILVVSHLTHHPITLGLQHVEVLLFVLTLLLCMVTFASGRTTVLQGAVHLVLFAAYLFFMFMG
jgi:Ca2+:H+ antiporter